MANQDEIDDDSPYRVRSRREIISLLTSMMEKNQLLSLMIKGGSESVITSILEVDADEDAITLDAAPSAMLNESIVSSKQIDFEAIYNSIRITFAVEGARQIEYQGRPALQVDIPESLVRLQRREFFRIPTPIAKPLRCTFRITQSDGSFVTVVTMLNNISAGGVGITDEKKLLSTTPGVIYEDCQLELGDNTLVSVKLQVRDCKELDRKSVV